MPSGITDLADDWTLAACAQPSRRGGRAARARRRSGRRLFFKANFHRFALGQALLTTTTGSAIENRRLYHQCRRSRRGGVAK